MNRLEGADRIEVLTLMDNYVDLLLPSTDAVERPARAKDGGIPTDTFVAEHGLSLLVTAFRAGEKHTILFDTGYTKVGVLHNMALLGIDENIIEAIVLSHGHMDHTGCLYPLLDKMHKPVPLVLHPDALLSPRYISFGEGQKLPFPVTLSQTDLKHKKVQINESKAPTLLAGNMIMVTGEVERMTSFEKGLPNAFMERDGKLEKDPVADDQALIMRLEGKGLVVISGCSHAGIINTVLYAKKITEEEAVHTVQGGFHLSGPQFESIIEETIAELKNIGPEVVSPMHCTGWKAMKRFEEEFPESFVLNSVGSRIVLNAS